MTHENLSNNGEMGLSAGLIEGPLALTVLGIIDLYGETNYRFRGQDGNVYDLSAYDFAGQNYNPMALKKDQTIIYVPAKKQVQ
jgi:hypothetical protein